VRYISLNVETATVRSGLIFILRKLVNFTYIVLVRPVNRPAIRKTQDWMCDFYKGHTCAALMNFLYIVGRETGKMIAIKAKPIVHLPIPDSKLKCICS